MTRSNKPDTSADLELKECLKSKTSFTVIAGAGSGKTTSLIKALKFIDEEFGVDLRQQNRKIACITYTTVAEHEIFEDVGYNMLFHVSTIHSFLWELIKPFQFDIKNWVISRIDEKLEKLRLDKVKFNNRHKQSTRDKNENDTLKYESIKCEIEAVRYFTYETGSNYLKGILGHADIIKMVPALIIKSPLLQSIIAEKYPYFFIDESQDTLMEFVIALKKVEKNFSKTFCLGFFGDPMQKIYMIGGGEITLEDGWKKIEKPENFRCSLNVLKVINGIRSGGDGLIQTGGRKTIINNDVISVEGTAQLFIFEADNQREEKIKLLRNYIAKKNADPNWNSDIEAKCKILVIEHRMAAQRLSFENIFSSFMDNDASSLALSFKEGTAWALYPFQQFILPLVSAYQDNQAFKVVQILRAFCPTLSMFRLKNSTKNASDILKEIKEHVIKLVELLDPKNNVKIGDVFKFVMDKELMILDERLVNHLNPKPSEALMIEDDELYENIDPTLNAFFACQANESWGYYKYLNEESPYSTQHSVKGAEFERVMVILDDDEGKNSKNYSYEKLFGLKELSQKDEENIKGGKDSTLDRSRRLFYVSCSRALQDLAVVLFVSDIDHTKSVLKTLDIFKVEDIIVESEVII